VLLHATQNCQFLCLTLNFFIQWQFFQKSEAEAILKKVIALSKADDIDATLSGGLEGNIRYARNTVSTSGLQDTLTLSVQSRFGKKVGSASTNEFDDASLEACVRRSEELAKLAPR
jgi:predicted Zn-dependent protease